MRRATATEGGGGDSRPEPAAAAATQQAPAYPTQQHANGTASKAAADEADHQQQQVEQQQQQGQQQGQQEQEQQPLLHQQRFGTTGYARAGWASRVTYAFVDPLLALGAKDKIDDGTAAAYLPQADTAAVLSEKFDATYAQIKAEQERKKRPCSASGLMWRTYWRLYKWRVCLHLFWTFIEIADRVGAPLVLRQLLTFFSGWEATDGNAELYPPWRGWMWAGVLGIFGYVYAIIHHQLFWIGMRLGMDMRQQAVAAVQAKVLRLNSVAVADQTAGKIVNLISNDVRRFDDAMPFYNFLIGGPVELSIVFVLVGLRLGFLASLAGCATLLMLIPTQGVLVRYIGRLRNSTAGQTDERVRLTGEVISGMLATKMLGWEDSFLRQITAIRRREAGFIRRMARIKAFNMGLSYAITPLSALAAFGVARATNTDQLTVANVFYSLALLSLPKLYMTDFFVHGVETVSELRISMRRLGAFLSLPEPPEPWHARTAASSGGSSGTGSGTNSGSGGSRRRSWDWRSNGKVPNGAAAAGAAANGVAKPAAAAAAAGAAAGALAVEIAGADFDWADRSWAHTTAAAAAAAVAATEHGGAAGLPPAAPLKGDSAAAPRVAVKVHDAGQAAAAAAGQAAAAAAGSGGSKDGFQLRGLQLAAGKGQLVAIVGAVGSGKSSILAALLGELQPTRPPEQQQQQQHSGPAGTQAAAGAAGTAAAAAAPPPVSVWGRVAYCSQVAWVVSGTVKENILFGLRYDKGRYQAALRACALEDDVADLPAGDDTELGERGINLSGGQKARLALARAAYSQADIQLLDDPLSAVDPRVGRILFDKCIGNTGLLAGTTRLLVTHQRQFLPACDTVLVLRAGQIACRGTYAELAAAGVPEVVATHETSLDDATYDTQTNGNGGANGGGDGGANGGDSTVEEGSEQQEEAAAATAAALAKEQDGGGSASISSGSPEQQRAPQHQQPQPQQKQTRFDQQVSKVFHEGTTSSKAAGSGSRWQKKLTGSYLRRAVSARFGGGGGGRGGKAEEESRIGDDDEDEELQEESSGKKAVLSGKSGRLIVTEDQAVGSVPWSIYGRYATRMGLPVVALLAAGLLGAQAIYLFGDYWLGLWASKPRDTQQELYWIWGYAIMVCSILLISFARSLLFFMSSLHASTRLHDEMAERVLRAPLPFFHTNPTGRILNRFSKDQGQVDEQLPQVFFDAVQALMMVLGAFILLMVVVPFIIPVFIPLGIAFFWVRRRYLRTSRELKRWEATSRSPVFASFSAILKGLPTIRAFNAGQRFRSSFLQGLSENGAWWFCFLTTARWIGFRLDLLVSLLMTVGPLLMMAVHDRLSARLAGLALSQSLQLAGMLQWMVRQSAEVENNMTSVERLLHYTQLEQEPPTLAQGGAKPPPGWPHSGGIEYIDVTAIYRTGLPPVLRNLTFSLEGGVSCGVVGRTGSGKSSLMLTLFRLIPVTGGTICIDGVDTGSIAVDALRRQIAIIPQDPVLFSGTLRSNLDPWGAFEDSRMWEVLQAAQLGPVVSALGGLDARMQEAGDNLSVGQRQLFCLARALLQDAVVLALDEATANVDRETDALIQQAVRECTRYGDRKRTLLVIAHRIDTIMDCDQLLVLSAGQLVEQGAPGQLAQSGGMFSRLVAAARSSGGSHTAQPT